MVRRKQRWWRLQTRNLQNYFYTLYLRSFKPINFIHGPKQFTFKLMLNSYLTYEILYS